MVLELFYIENNFFVLNPKQISQYALQENKSYKRIKFQDFQSEADAKRVFGEIRQQFTEKALTT